ncbi:hypothetical protein BJV74DRAFT_74704 [Russula compacta]|nr:hypothetical protein BJV74DRAFT_74704 [Russula compacta]
MHLSYSMSRCQFSLSILSGISLASLAIVHLSSDWTVNNGHLAAPAAFCKVWMPQSYLVNCCRWVIYVWFDSVSSIRDPEAEEGRKSTPPAHYVFASARAIFRSCLFSST